MSNINSDMVNKPEFKRSMNKLAPAFKALSSFSGVYGWAFFLMILVGTLSLGGVFAYQIRTEIEMLDRDFRQAAKSITLSLAEASERAIVTRKFSPLILMFDQIIEEEKQNDGIALIDEIFLLGRQGEVLAHPDPTQITVNAKSVVSKISGHYNNEFFHNSILLSPGDVYVQPYPSDKFDRGGQLLPLLKPILPRENDLHLTYFRAVDFSMPIRLKKRSEASLHVVMSRRNIDALLIDKVYGFGYAWAAMAGVCLVFTLLLAIPVQKKWKQIQGLLTMIKSETEEARLQEEIEYIDKKIEELKHTSTLPLLESRHGDILEPIEESNIKDAILIEDHDA